MKTAALSVLLLVPLGGMASPGDSGDQKLDFGITFAKHEATFEYRNARADTTIETINLAWYEHVAPRWEVGLIGGYSFATQTGHALTQGVELEGHHGGVGLRGTLLELSHASVFLDATYTYHRVTSDTEDQETTLTWYVPQLRIGAVFMPAKNVRLSAGANVSSIDGRETAKGIASHTEDFEQGPRGGAFIGADLAVENRGHIGFELQTGTARGSRVYFTAGF